MNAITPVELHLLQAKAMPEYELLSLVLDLAKTLRLRTLHILPAHTEDGGWITAVAGDGKGFPDLLILGSEGVLYRELKTTKGRCTPEQSAWLAALDGAGENGGIWTPVDWFDGTIRKELEAIR